ncbi:hypothetical protein CYMTET_27709 [Cymbomonas tetramitiformis]|uniref:N-acetyltransferase domain-containing protein n=1 Tax=Cymbomonas tetramitiformis TaxID=36881 RepID=A0AAE0FPN7_9CHLO|nr:hypothetical protein CYMTET_27709 [Cymbomonas tetramitiformis]
MQSSIYHCAGKVERESHLANGARVLSGAKLNIAPQQAHLVYPRNKSFSTLTTHLRSRLANTQTRAHKRCDSSAELSERTLPASTSQISSSAPRSRPQVKLSVKKKDAIPEEMVKLLGQDAQEEDLRKLELAVEAKTAIIVTAFIPQVEDDGGDSAMKTPWSWPLAKARRRRLVGSARAITDGELVAIVNDVRVAEDLRGLGVGQKLMRRLTNEIMKKGIYDIGLVAPDQFVPFFRECRFGPDHEDAVTMQLTAEGAREMEARRADVSYHLKMPSLESILDQAFIESGDALSMKL